MDGVGLKITEDNFKRWDYFLKVEVYDMEKIGFLFGAGAEMYYGSRVLQKNGKKMFEHLLSLNNDGKLHLVELLQDLITEDYLRQKFNILKVMCHRE